MKIFKYSTYSFLNNADLLKEGSEFMQYQFGIEPMSQNGGSYSFAVDPKTSTYNYQDSPYVDFYARQSGLVANLNQVMKGFRSTTDSIYKQPDLFLEDIDLYKNLKILRIFENNKLKLDIFISFDYDGQEFFGAYKDFNGLQNPKLESEIFYDPRLKLRFDNEYRLKISNYLHKKLEKWFIPDKGLYKNLKQDNRLKDYMGKLYEMRKDQIVEVLGYNRTSDNKPFLMVNIKGKTYNIQNNDYYYFKWRFEKLN